MKLSQIQEEVTEVKGNVVVKPPERPEKSVYKTHTKLFLAGSIEQGKAEDWQTKITNEITDSGFEKVAIFNPRRDDWDSSWKQSIENKKFNEQVTWEMDHLDNADIIAVYFDPKTKAPITLLELGLHAKDGKMIVSCPDGFWRKGNVEMVCDRFNIPLVDSLDKLIEGIKSKLTK